LSDLNGARSNPLQCVAFGPVALGCGCPHGFHLSPHCGYVRCTATRTGCPTGSLFNSSSCTAAPWSSCVLSEAVLGRQFYSTVEQAFQPVTACASAYPRAGGIGFLTSYQYAEYTQTSDRLCSICSTCPQGYDATQCTTTTDRCRAPRLNVVVYPSVCYPLYCLQLSCSNVADNSAFFCSGTSASAPNRRRYLRWQSPPSPW
jgi:hypothetical protein